MRFTRRFLWIAAARKDFEDFPSCVKDIVWDTLSIAAEGGCPDNMKPLAGLGSGVMQISVRHHGDAYRVIIALQAGVDVWVVHAFKKKSHRGGKTPLHEIKLVHQRLWRIKEHCP
jgi:phage-related protein